MYTVVNGLKMLTQYYLYSLGQNISKLFKISLRYTIRSSNSMLHFYFCLLFALIYWFYFKFNIFQTRKCSVVNFKLRSISRQGKTMLQLKLDGALTM